ARVAVVAGDGRVEARARRGVAGVGGAGIPIVAGRLPLARRRSRRSGLNALVAAGAGIPVVARLAGERRERAPAGRGRTDVRRAGVAVVAEHRSRQAAARGRVADVVRAGVAVVAVDGRPADARDAGVPHGARVAVVAGEAVRLGDVEALSRRGGASIAGARLAVV